jgi:hypothetical protein
VITALTEAHRIAEVLVDLHGGWRRLAQRKLADLDDQIAKAQTAKEAITHALHCPHNDIATCPNFTNVVTARLAGQPLEEAHPH